MAINSTAAAPDIPKAMIDAATASSEWIIVLPVLLGLFGGAFLLVLHNQRRSQATFAVLVTLTIVVCDILLLGRTLDGGPVSMTMGRWLAPFGISFTADVLSAAFALAAAVVTLVVILYMQPQVQARDIRYGIYPLTLLLLAGVSGAFLTGDLFNLYVWFEVMLIASFGLLIMGGRKIQLDAAVKYGFLNFLATTFFLAALGFLYGLLGTLNMADIVGAAAKAPPAPMAAIAALLLLAFGMKAAAFPVNAWLPASYHAPDPAISALFAGVLTKVGAYALLRSLIALMPTARDFLDPAITTIAVLTLVIAPMGAIAQTNLRRALGFLVIGGVGSIIAALALPDLRGVAGGSIYAFNSMLAMTALYLLAGLIERMTGTDDTRSMGGVYAVNSPLSIAFFILVIAAAGLPPTLGFWPKLLLVEASISANSNFLLVAILLNSILTTIAGSRLWAHIFWRQGREGPHSEELNDRLRALSGADWRWSFMPTAGLVAFLLLAGILPNFIISAGREAAAGLLDTGRYVSAVGLEQMP